MEDGNKTKLRKHNMKLFPIYKTLSWDYIFFYTIHFLFLTQVKNINPADVVLVLFICNFCTNSSNIYY